MTAKRQVLLNRTSYKRKGGHGGAGVNLKQRNLVDLLARTLQCRKGCKAMFREDNYRDKHERDFHDERA